MKNLFITVNTQVCFHKNVDKFWMGCHPRHRWGCAVIRHVHHMYNCDKNLEKSFELNTFSLGCYRDYIELICAKWWELWLAQFEEWIHLNLYYDIQNWTYSMPPQTMSHMFLNQVFDIYNLGFLKHALEGPHQCSIPTKPHSCATTTEPGQIYLINILT